MIVSNCKTICYLIILIIWFCCKWKTILSLMHVFFFLMKTEDSCLFIKWKTIHISFFIHIRVLNDHAELYIDHVTQVWKITKFLSTVIFYPLFSTYGYIWKPQLRLCDLKRGKTKWKIKEDPLKIANLCSWEKPAFYSFQYKFFCNSGYHLRYIICFPNLWYRGFKCLRQKGIHNFFSLTILLVMEGEP